MAGPQRWSVVLVLVALGPALAGCGSEEPTAEPEARARDAVEATDPALPPGVRVHTGAGVPAARRVMENCEPGSAASEYADFVGQRAFVTLRWSGASERTASLRIPVAVAAIEDDAVAVRFLEFPMREEYLHVWLGSGHIRATTGDTFLLDPCSATLEPRTSP